MPQSPANAEQAVVAVAYASGEQMKLHETGSDAGSVGGAGSCSNPAATASGDLRHRGEDSPGAVAQFPATPLAIAAVNGLSIAAPARWRSTTVAGAVSGPPTTVLREGRPSLLLGSAQGDELDLLAAQPDLKFIAGLQAQLGGVSLADEQVAIELHLGVEAQAAARTALAATAPRCHPG